MRILSILLATAFVACNTIEPVKNAKADEDMPSIYPDYVGVTIPVNVAPLDFCSADSAVVRIDAIFRGTNGMELHAQGTESTCIDADEWSALLAACVGDSMTVEVSMLREDGWHTYKPFGIHVSTDSIDYGIVYRLISPGYEAYGKMGIYQTCIATSEQTPIFENTQFRGCVNCHSFNRCSPASMSLHVRGEHGATLIGKAVDGGDLQLKSFETRTKSTLGSCVYPYWHPSGDYIAYSTNITRQGFHSSGSKIIEVVDVASDVLVYDVRNNQLFTAPQLSSDSVFETFPSFSPDGRTLYFCSAAKPNGDVDVCQLRYDLCSVSFNPDDGSFGTRVDTLVQASERGKSVSFPRPSFDGRFLCYSEANYGQFHVWHNESDLYMLDLSTGISSPMVEVNSSRSESVHNWSSNSRWMVFGSRRDDGLFTRPYFTHVNTTGKASKPFMLPQRNPRKHYGQMFASYNIPEFVTSQVKFNRNRAEKLINSPDRIQMEYK